MSYADAIGRVAAIQAQLGALTGGAAPATPTASAQSASGVTHGTYAAADTSGSFASVLAAAQGTAPSTPATLGPGAMLTGNQQQFATRLAADTGLSPQVITAWLLAEENGDAAAARQRTGNNDWLNIGYTDTGTYGSGDAVWSDPVSAADATAGWLAGRNTIPGYGQAAPGIQAILATAGQPVSAQVAAIQRSGWASSGYPDLPGLVAQLSA